jgi:acyl-CoA synthetase (AMP-forming)/AMP-acid ligase II
MAGTPEPTTLPQIALRRLRRHPDAPFVETISDREPFDVTARSYADVVDRAAALADALLAAGVGAGARVGCYLPNSPCWVVASLAVWSVGGAVAAVGTLLADAEAQRLFELAGVDAVVALDGTPSTWPGLVVRIDEEGVVVDGDGHGDVAAFADRPLPAADDLAAVFFTSGTTGRPKGITYSHADFVDAGTQIVAAYARNPAYRPDAAPPGLTPGVVFNAYGHTAGYVRLAFRMWIGRSVLLIPKFGVSAVRALLARFEVDTLPLTPTMVHMLATTDVDLDLHALQYVTSGTAPLAVSTRERFEARFGVPVLQAYGMTEVGAVAQERLDDVRAGRRGPGSVGRVAKGVEVRIRHLDDDRPPDEGEILVRTPSTPEEFVGGQPAPVDADGWFSTGDVGRIDDGILYITGRAMEKIIVGGFNVYPAEVEDELRRSPLVRDAVVVGLPDERLGEQPVAGVVWSGPPDEAALADDLRARLAHYKLPRAWFALDAVPLTARDKVDRRRAATLAAEALAVPAGGDERTIS